MRLLLGCATMSDPAYVGRWADAVLRQSGIERDVLVVCNVDRVVEACRAVEKLGVNVAYPQLNLGTCASWNLIMNFGQISGYDGAFITGDDVTIDTEWGLSLMVEAAERDPDRLYFVQGLGFSGFCVTKQVLHRVGWFDEGFWPAYFEDNDYHWRAKQVGVEWSDVPIKVSHVGSGSLKGWKEWEDYNANRVFVTNQRRYVEKWGGGPGHEQWTEPWHGCPERAWNTKDWLRMAGWAPPWKDPFFEEAHSGGLRHA